MKNLDTIERLQLEMRKLPHDIKVEPQLALAIDKGLLPEDFMITCDSLFYREYSKDILYSEVKEDAAKKSLLYLHLTRSGIVDQLPEGIFFQPGIMKASNGAADMVAEYKLNKQKAEEIRKFFMPFENDFFWQRLELEKEESKLLQGLESGIMNDYFASFWGIPADVPSAFMVPLILLLPHAHKIAGDLSLTAACLEALLKEKVTIKQFYAGAASMPGEEGLSLGLSCIGLDMICGETFYEDVPALDCSIGPLQYSTVADYLGGGKYFPLLQTFFDFFIPAEADINTTIEVREQVKHMVIKEEDEPVLGYSSFLSRI